LDINPIWLEERAELAIGRTEVLIEWEILAATNPVAQFINRKRLERD
jgi:hypothetical protein